MSDPNVKVVSENDVGRRRQYFKSGFFSKQLTEEEREHALELLDAIIDENPDIAESTAFMIAAQMYVRNVVLDDRLPPPRSIEDHGTKVSVSRSKIVMGLQDQLGLTRKQRKENDSKDAAKKWLAESGLMAVPAKERKRFDGA